MRWAQIKSECAEKGWPLEDLMRFMMEKGGAAWDKELWRHFGPSVEMQALLSYLEKQQVIAQVMDVCRPERGGYEVTEWWMLEGGRLRRLLGRWEVKSLSSLLGRPGRSWTAWVFRERWYMTVLRYLAEECTVSARLVARWAYFERVRETC